MTSRGSHSVSTAAVELADYLVAAVEPETSTGVVELRLSQRQIALDRGVSVGTIHQHLTSLSDLGVRVSSRPLRLDIKRLAEIKRRGHLHIVTDESAPHSPVAAQSEEATGPSSAASALPDPWATPAVAALYELASIAMAELGPDAAPVIEKIAAQIVEVMTSGVREKSPTRSRKPQAEQSNERSRGPARGQPREKPREKPRDLEISLVSELEKAPNYLSSRGSRAETARLVPDSRGSEPRESTKLKTAATSGANRSIADLRELLRPLHEVCRLQKLPGLDNAAQARDLLAHLSDPQLAFGVRRMIDRLNQTHQITVPIGWFIKRATAADLDTEWFPTTAPDPAEWSFIFQACGIDLDLKIEQWPSRFRRIAESLTDKEVAGWPLDEATKHLAIDPKDPMLSPALSAMARRALIAAARSDDPDYEPNRSTEPPSEQTKAQRREVIDAGLGNVRSILRSPSPSPDGPDG